MHYDSPNSPILDEHISNVQCQLNKLSSLLIDNKCSHDHALAYLKDSEKLDKDEESSEENNY